MKPYYQDNLTEIYYGDCLESMDELPDGSVDLLCTDPPYGLSFMGKDWDKAVPSVEIWRECLRVLKPGAFAFVMCIPRQDCLSRMIVNLGDAGFETGFTSIYWAYASGFPKAQNIGKAVDKRGGISVGWFGEWLRKWRLENGITQKKIAKLFPSKMGGLTGCVANWELGYNIPTPQEFTIICRHFNLPFESIEEAEREIIGLNPNNRPNSMGENAKWPEGFYQREYKPLTKATTPQAKALDGSYGGWQPKPAVEVILVCMKPLSEKTYVDQALKNQKGITWLDDGRIPFVSEDDKESSRFGSQMDITGGNLKTPKGIRAKNVLSSQSGRFCANLLVSDDVLDDGRERTSGKMAAGITRQNRNGYSAPMPETTNLETIGDSGSFSRYFSLDQWAQRTFPFLIVPKASKAEKNRGCEGLQGEKYVAGNYSQSPVCKTCNLTLNGTNDHSKCSGEVYYRDMPSKHTHNNHPTCKPLKLMSYLITLGSREGDTVLDPFVGSGTTCLAAKMLNRKSIGFEIDEGYCEIAAKRCEATIPQMVMELAT